MKVECIRNTSKTMAYYEGFVYEAEPLPGGMYKIKDGAGQHIIAPLNGHYLEFLPIK
jgi:hypothetical protein|nr:MAG TPA: hypothetical protein [Caudoviricetes sp.]